MIAWAHPALQENYHRALALLQDLVERLAVIDESQVDSPNLFGDFERFLHAELSARAVEAEDYNDVRHIFYFSPITGQNGQNWAPSHAHNRIAQLVPNWTTLKAVHTYDGGLYLQGWIETQLVVDLFQKTEFHRSCLYPWL